MRMNIEPDKKIVAFWLSNDEKNDAALCASLKPLYADFHALGYVTAIFLSGQEDLYDTTRALLLTTRRRMAEKEVRGEGKSTAD